MSPFLSKEMFPVALQLATIQLVPSHDTLHGLIFYSSGVKPLSKISFVAIRSNVSLFNKINLSLMERCSSHFIRTNKKAQHHLLSVLFFKNKLIEIPDTSPLHKK